MDSKRIYIGVLQGDEDSNHLMGKISEEVSRQNHGKFELQLCMTEQEFRQILDLNKIRENPKFIELLKAFPYEDKTELGLLLNVKGGMRRIPLKDIYYIEIQGRKVRIVAKDEVIEASNTIGELEEKLSDQGFIRSHKSFLANLRHVIAFTCSELELSSGEKVPVSKRRTKNVKMALCEFSKNN